MLKLMRKYLKSFKKGVSGGLKKITSFFKGGKRAANMRRKRFKSFMQKSKPYLIAGGSAAIGSAVTRYFGGTSSETIVQSENPNLIPDPVVVYRKTRSLAARDLTEAIEDLVRADSLSTTDRRKCMLRAIDKIYDVFENMPSDSDVEFALAGIRTRQALMLTGLDTEESFDSEIIARYIANRKDDDVDITEIESSMLEAIALAADNTPLKSA